MWGAYTDNTVMGGSVPSVMERLCLHCTDVNILVLTQYLSFVRGHLWKKPSQVSMGTFFIIFTTARESTIMQNI